jgi:excisionase family DNA binding protein
MSALSKHALPPTLTVEEAAGMLGISRGLAYQGVANGDLPSIKVGRRILIPTGRLMALLGPLSAEREQSEPIRKARSKVAKRRRL